MQINFQVPDAYVDTQPKISAYFEILSTSTGAHYTLSDLTSINCTLYNGSIPVQNIGLVQGEGNWFGNGSIPVADIVPSSTPYLLEVNYSLGNESYKGEFYLYKYIHDSPEVSLTSLSIDVDRDQSLSVHFNSTVENQTISISGFRDSIFSQTPAFDYSGTIFNTNRFSLNLTLWMPSGYYVVALRNNIAGHDPFVSNRSIFFVNNSAPSINKGASSFQGVKFSSIEQGGGIVIQDVQTSAALSVVVSGSDAETATSNLTAFAIFFPTYLINNSVGLITYSNPPTAKLTYNAASGSFSGKITIPASASFIVNEQTIKKTFATSGNYSGAIVVILRDSDGDFDYFIVLLKITTPPSLTIIFAVVLIVAIAVGSLLLAIALIKQR